MLLTLAVLCALTGVVMNATVSPKRLSHHVAVELGLLVLALWAAGFVLLLFAIARFNRARRIETQDLARHDVQRVTAAQVTRAGELAAQLLAGTLPVADRVWDVVLRPDESALLDITAGYSRYYGLKAPAANAAPQWREHQQCRVVVTDRRLLCQVRSHGWLSFEHSAARSMRTVPETSSVVLEYPGTSPLCLSGPSSASVIVVVVWALHGADGLREHPALAEVRPLPLPATPVAEATASGRRPAPTSESVHSEGVAIGEATVGEDGPEDLLTFVAAHELVLDEHAIALLGVGREEAFRRLDELCGQGLLTRIRLSGLAAAAYRITEQGSELVDPALPALGPLDLAGYRDAAGLPWLWSMARAGRFGDQRAVMTRRQMQAADSAGRTGSLLDD